VKEFETKPPLLAEKERGFLSNDFNEFPTPRRKTSRKSHPALYFDEPKGFVYT